MAEPFLGEIRLFPFHYAPEGWALCDGSLLEIRRHQALYSLLGKTFGGDGVNNFRLPDLRGRVPVCPGFTVRYGQESGEESHVLTIGEMPQHNHQAMGNSEPGTTKEAAGGVWAASPKTYGGSANVMMNAQALSPSGEGKAHNNMQPYTVVNYCIALVGIYPTRP